MTVVSSFVENIDYNLDVYNLVVSIYYDVHVWGFDWMPRKLLEHLLENNGWSLM